MKTPQTKKQTTTLLLMLVASLFFAVNCAKPSNGKRAGVTAQTTAGKGQPGGATTNNEPQLTEEQKIAQAKECSEGLKTTVYAEINLYKKFATTKPLKTDAQETLSTEEFAKLSEEYLKKCEEIKSLFAKEAAQTLLCKSTPAKESQQKAMLFRWTAQKDSISARCNYIGAQVKRLLNKDNAFAQAAEEEILASLQKESFAVSEELKSMTKEEALKFKSFVVDGNIKNDASALRDSLDKKKVVCSFVQVDEELEAKNKVIFKFLQFGDADAANLPKGVNGKSVIFTSAIEKDSETTPGPMLTVSCVHMSKDSILMETILKTFGQHLKAEKKKIEVTLTSEGASQDTTTTASQDTTATASQDVTVSRDQSATASQDQSKAASADDSAPSVQDEAAAPTEAAAQQKSEDATTEQAVDAASQTKHIVAQEKTQSAKAGQMTFEELRRLEIQQRNNDAAYAAKEAVQAQQQAEVARMQKAKEDFRRSEIQAMNAAANTSVSVSTTSSTTAKENFRRSEIQAMNAAANTSAKAK